MFSHTNTVELQNARCVHHLTNYLSFNFAAATVGFAEISYTVCEEEGARIELNVTKQGPVAGPVGVQYFTLAGQAKGKLLATKCISSQ